MSGDAADPLAGGNGLEGGSREGPEGEGSGEAPSGSPEPLLRLSAEELQRGIEAVLFSTGEPVPVRQLAELFECSVHDVREAVEELRLSYAGSGRSFQIEDIAGGVQILTMSRYEPWVRKHLSRTRDSRLSQAAFETLAVIAYRQPINRADLEAIRGVQCGPILKTLMDRNLVKVVGREDSLGKPLLYGTTRRFLESFGLSSLAGLPQPAMDAGRGGPEGPPPPAGTSAIPVPGLELGGSVRGAATGEGGPDAPPDGEGSHLSGGGGDGPDAGLPPT